MDPADLLAELGEKVASAKKIHGEACALDERYAQYRREYIARYEVPLLRVQWDDERLRKEGKAKCAQCGKVIEDDYDAAVAEAQKLWPAENMQNPHSRVSVCGECYSAVLASMPVGGNA